MKNTKTIIISIISLLVLIGIIGATSALLIGSLKKADEMLDDAMGELIMGEDTTSPEGTETGSEPADPWADGKLTYADGEVKICSSTSTEKGQTYYGVCADNLKPNTKYAVTYSIDPLFERYDFHFSYYDRNGIYCPYIIWSLSKIPGTTSIDSSDGSLSDLINFNYSFTTDSNGYLALLILYSDGISEEIVSSQKDVFKNIIVSFEIEEVV